MNTLTAGTLPHIIVAGCRFFFSRAGIKFFETDRAMNEEFVRKVHPLSDAS